MKYSSLILALTLCLFIGCKKDKPRPQEDSIDNRPPSEVIESLITELSEVASISDFTDALKNIPLTKEETSKGLTIFAPLNGGTVNVSSKKPEKTMSIDKVAETNDVNPEPPALTEESLKDHIVKGIYNESDLTNGLTIISLSGKSLKITKSGDDLYINGVLISTSGVTSGDKEAIYIVQKVLSNTTISDPPTTLGSIEITVWDALQWSPAKPNGEIVSEADVLLFRTQEDYANDLPAYQGKTNANGKVTFQNLEAGKYYIEVWKGDLSNVFYESEIPQDGKLVGLAAAGIFQSQDEVESSQQSDAALGKLKWVDINADGVINDNDFTAVPYEFADVESGTVQVSILIGPSESQPSGPTEQEIRDFFETTEAGISNWHTGMVMLDGVLSDDSDAPSGATAYQPIDHFDFDATNNIILDNWGKAYQLISNLNRIIQDAPGVLQDPTILLGQAKTLRAYIYLQLATYFGSVPLQTEPVMNANITRSSLEQVYAQIEADLDAALTTMPQSIPGSGKAHVDRLTAFAIAAKASLMQGAYNNVEGHVGVLMNSGKFALASTNDNAFTTNSPETVWDDSSLMPALFKNYFDNRQVCPYIRYTEIYLIAAEAALESPQGDLSKAIDYLNILRSREGLPPLGSSSQAELRAVLQETWRTSMRKEGNRFANLVRWGTASMILGSKGYTDGKNNVLPIPQSFIDQYPNVMPTSGY